MDIADMPTNINNTKCLNDECFIRYSLIIIKRKEILLMKNLPVDHYLVNSFSKSSTKYFGITKESVTSEEEAT